MLVIQIIVLSKQSTLLSEGFPSRSGLMGIIWFPCCNSRGLPQLAFSRKLGSACLQPYREELLSAVGVDFSSVSGAKPAGRCDTNGRFHFCSSLEAEGKKRNKL